MNQRHAEVMLTVDVIVLRAVGGNPGCKQILLIKRANAPYKDMWALPGGKLDMNDNSLEEAVRREVREETGLRLPGVEQVYTFGDVGRDERGRYISVLYVAYVLDRENKATAGSDASSVQWFSLDQLPPLAFDHEGMLEVARQYGWLK